MKARIHFDNGRKLYHSEPGDVVFLPDKADGLSPINMEIPWLICRSPGRGPLPPTTGPQFQTSARGDWLFAVNLLNGELRSELPNASAICRPAKRAVLNLHADGD